MLPKHTQKIIFNNFLEEMRLGPEMALSTSFSKYSFLKDQLVEEYANLTGIPSSEFLKLLDQQHLQNMLRHRTKSWY